MARVLFALDPHLRTLIMMNQKLPSIWSPIYVVSDEAKAVHPRQRLPVSAIPSGSQLPSRAPEHHRLRPHGGASSLRSL